MVDQEKFNNKEEPTKSIFKNKKFQIELFWSAIVGILFSMMPRMFSAQEFEFTLRSWWRALMRGGRNPDEFHLFLFGFVLAMFLIYSIKKYKDSE
jgi:hypothetical protein|tara:strand:+ start:265 stop:549 length:285 start_codon:yes stop_codon:yes gene_type:complete